MLEAAAALKKNQTSMIIDECIKAEANMPTYRNSSLRDCKFCSEGRCTLSYRVMTMGDQKTGFLYLEITPKCPKWARVNVSWGMINCILHSSGYTLYMYIVKHSMKEKSC